MAAIKEVVKGRSKGGQREVEGRSKGGQSTRLASPRFLVCFSVLFVVALGLYVRMPSKLYQYTFGISNYTLTELYDVSNSALLEQTAKLDSISNQALLKKATKVIKSGATLMCAYEFEKLLNQPYEISGSNQTTFIKKHNQSGIGTAAIIKTDWKVGHWPSITELEASNPIILVSGMNENTGAFSQTLYLGTGNTRIRATKSWNNVTRELLGMQISGKNPTDDIYKPVRDFFDHPKVLAVIYLQNREVHHPKFVNIPLGVKNWMRSEILNVHNTELDFDIDRDILMFSGMPKIGSGGARPFIYACLKKKFGDTFVMPHKRLDQTMNYNFTLRAKYTLTWPGDGVDTYRATEALCLGSIPIILTRVGLDSAYENLPVLWVDDYADVTPELLEREYPKFLARANEYEYERLTEDWWLEKVQGLAHFKTSKRFQNLFPRNLEIGDKVKVIERELINLNTSCPFGEYKSLPKLEDIPYWREWLACAKTKTCSKDFLNF